MKLKKLNVQQMCLLTRKHVACGTQPFNFNKFRVNKTEINHRMNEKKAGHPQIN